jgi:hypothetical protein
VGSTVGVPGLLQICGPQAGPELRLQMGRAPCRGVVSDDGVGGCGWCVAVVDGGPEIAEPLGGWLGERAVEEGRKEIYMYALTKPHGPCRGSSGSDIYKQIKQNQNRDIKHPTA